ncbi:MAG: hypothetical protein KC431_29535 [Myxococcales bacterium]|nr:hypothetical protein [Myxococcales bacterium]
MSSNTMNLSWHQDNGSSNSNGWSSDCGSLSGSGCTANFSTNTPHVTIFAVASIDEDHGVVLRGVKFSKDNDASLRFSGTLQSVTAYNLISGDPKIKFGSIGDTNFHSGCTLQWDDHNKSWFYRYDDDPEGPLALLVGGTVYLTSSDSGDPYSSVLAQLASSSNTYLAGIYHQDPTYGTSAGNFWPCEAGENPLRVSTAQSATLEPEVVVGSTCTINYFQGVPENVQTFP